METSLLKKRRCFCAIVIYLKCDDIRMGANFLLYDFFDPFIPLKNENAKCFTYIDIEFALSDRLSYTDSVYHPTPTNFFTDCDQ